MTTNTSTLAIHGGAPVRSIPMPSRKAFGDEEMRSLLEAAQYYRDSPVDLPYQDHFEKAFCEEFVKFMGGGYADAVATGTASVFVALQALDLPKGSEVILSGVVDSGPLNSILFLGYVPVIADTAPGSYNIDVAQFKARCTDRTSALIAVHCAGEALAIDEIVDAAHASGIKVLEDCSQAPGAVWKGKRVGTFGDIAATSTMYRKSLMSGSSGGIVYATKEKIYQRALACADRGKPLWRDDYNIRDPRTNLFPALNWNTDELSCAIGLASLRRLEDTIARRTRFLDSLSKRLQSESQVCRVYKFRGQPSPFFVPVVVDLEKISCPKITFANAVQAEGIDLNPHYAFLVTDWQYALPYLPADTAIPNAIAFRDSSFNLFVNENYGDDEVDDTIKAILKVEACFAR
ncbi:MAG: glutamine--scyllo-inositol aminotransferase [Rhodospirillales bacterium CG15_BIG_FIL_POST_REV_8_21_14_020_66_15]|nr:MAG: glutamine--scyllo-inositol aminotransferase [Rhodospirillales bacterium CG15_BIG_FIL_POST_REV_8_21_14_020_66_15]